MIIKKIFLTLTLILFMVSQTYAFDPLLIFSGVPTAAAGGGIALVGSSQCYLSGEIATGNAICTLSVTAGNKLIIAANVYNGNPDPFEVVSDETGAGDLTSSITHHVRKYKDDNDSEFCATVWSADIDTTGTVTILVENSAVGSTYYAISLSEWSGMNAAPYDTSTSDYETDTTHEPADVTPTNDNSIILGVMSFTASTTLTPDATYSVVTTQANNGDGNGTYVGLSVGYILQGSKTADAPAWGTSGSLTSVTIAGVFKP